MHRRSAERSARFRIRVSERDTTPARVGERSEFAKSLEREDNLSSGIHPAFRAPRCIRGSRPASTPRCGAVRIHRGEGSGRCTDGRCIHQYASAGPCRRAIKSRQITGAILNTFARRIYLSQCGCNTRYRDKCSRIKRPEFNIAERP